MHVGLTGNGAFFSCELSIRGRQPLLSQHITCDPLGPPVSHARLARADGMRWARAPFITLQPFVSNSLFQPVWRTALSQNLLESLSGNKPCPLFEYYSAFSTSACYLSPVPETERSGKSSYVDRIRVEVQAGNGGSGCVAFWKSAAKGCLEAVQQQVDFKFAALFSAQLILCRKVPAS